ncbi:MAG: PilZ domain-containing protein [Deltaproteobacteria bacterium]|nr:PilZ domain-containing protein [Deltaproteobacteria bacterium]
MLIMKCPECDKHISSALLAEIPRIQCEHCGAQVPVVNVLVSANGFTFDRSDLLKRFFRFRKLLDEVTDERNVLVNSSTASEESKRSIEQFLSILQGMMTGARDNFRYQFESQVVTKVTYEKQHCHGNFINLSMEGACVDIASTNPLPRIGGDVAVEFSLFGSESKFILNGKVCWIQKGKEQEHTKHSVGLKFSSFDDSLKTALWDYLSGLSGDVHR